MATTHQDVVFPGTASDTIREIIQKYTPQKQGGAVNPLPSLAAYLVKKNAIQEITLETMIAEIAKTNYLSQKKSEELAKELESRVVILARPISSSPTTNPTKTVETLPPTQKTRSSNNSFEFENKKGVDAYREVL